MLGQGATRQAVPGATDRRAVRRAATRDEILQAAWALARAEGLAALSMRDLAAAVGMRVPSLYQYFDSKLAIYDAMFGQGMTEALADRGGWDRRAGRPRCAAGEWPGTRRVHRPVIPSRNQLLFQRTIPGFEPSPDSYAPAVALSTRVQSLFVDLGYLRARSGHGPVDGADRRPVQPAARRTTPEARRWIRLFDRVV